MSEKLTRESIISEFGEMHHNSTWQQYADKAWRLMQADREAIRAEVREEVMKDHFRIGENVILRDSIGRDIPGQVVIRESKEVNAFIHAYDNTCSVRRPPKTRPMDHGELLLTAQRHGILGRDALGWHFDSEPLREALSRAVIPTEVTE